MVRNINFTRSVPNGVENSNYSILNKIETIFYNMFGNDEFNL